MSYKGHGVLFPHMQETIWNQCTKEVTWILYNLQVN